MSIEKLKAGLFSVLCSLKVFDRDDKSLNLTGLALLVVVIKIAVEPAKPLAWELVTAFACVLAAYGYKRYLRSKVHVKSDADRADLEAVKAHLVQLHNIVSTGEIGKYRF